MKFKTVSTIFSLALALGIGVASLSAAERKRDLHVTKDCSNPGTMTPYAGHAGDFCTITSSNVPQIHVGSKIFYDQAAGIPTGLLDSNVVLDAGNGDRAVGRCTLDFATSLGLCTFSDGTGSFAGFHARIDVSPLGGPDFQWHGTFSFEPRD